MGKLWVQVLRVFLTLLIPIVIVLGIVRLVATEAYLAFEYNKTDFPGDPFGFDRAQRLAYAAANFRFMTQNQSITDLAGQKQNGVPLYNARELKHMQDVQDVYQTAWRVWQFALVLAMLSGLTLSWRKENRPIFASALRMGGILTVGMVVVIGLAAIAAWQAWFVVFHQVFFTAGSWTFDLSATVIRLFPEKFWYDTALTISNISPLVGFLVYLVGSHLFKSDNRVSGWRESGKTTQLIQPLDYSGH
jgi:integral membrane protein (TIGR01906 family)